jgi:DNA-binding GntR family transcriptional regulator
LSVNCLKECNPTAPPACCREPSEVDQANTNAAFHDEIYCPAPNQSLSKFVVRIRNRVIPGSIAPYPSHGGLQRSAAHHIDIVAAIEIRDIVAPIAGHLSFG